MSKTVRILPENHPSRFFRTTDRSTRLWNEYIKEQRYYVRLTGIDECDQEIWTLIKERWPTASSETMIRVHDRQFFRYKRFLDVKQSWAFDDSLANYPIEDVAEIALDSIGFREPIGEEKPIFGIKIRQKLRELRNKFLCRFGKLMPVIYQHMHHKPERLMGWRIITLRIGYSEEIDTLVYTQPEIRYEWRPL